MGDRIAFRTRTIQSKLTDRCQLFVLTTDDEQQPLFPFNRDLIRILLQSRRFDFGTLLLSEGDPSNEALEVKESVEVSEVVEVNKERRTPQRPSKQVVEEKKIATTSEKPSSEPQSESGSSEGHYRDGQCSFVCEYCGPWDQ